MGLKSTFSFTALPAPARGLRAEVLAAPATASGDWERLRQGDPEAFTAVYYQHIDALYHYGERLTPDKALIEDCLQDLFAELWNRRRRLPEVDSVKFYLFKALTRKIIKKCRQAQRMSARQVDEYDFEITLAPEFELVDSQMASQEKNQLLRAINRLSPRQKEAITLYFYDGFSYEEVGEIMAMGTRSVYNLVYRGLTALRHTLDVNRVRNGRQQTEGPQ